MNGRLLPQKIFETAAKATAWAEKYAEESCHLHHRWEVERVGTIFAVGIYSINSTEFSHWAE